MEILTQEELNLLVAARREFGGFHHATEWFLRGWFPQAYQYAYHQVRQKNTTFLAGIAAGKTVSSAASCTIDCISIPYFKALNTSVTAKQAELPFEMFMAWMTGNPSLENLVHDIKLRPWPIVHFKNYSEYEFRTAGADARFIRGTEYDRIVYDEAGLDYLGSTVKVLRGRLRGERPDKTKRLARLDVITSPSDALWLIERFNRGWRHSDIANLARYISFKVRTRDNKALTEEQISLMEAEYTPEMIAVEMDAEFPDYGMSLFPKRHIAVCTKQEIADEIYISLNPEDEKQAPASGYVWDEHPRYGVTRYEMPFDPRGIYVLAGDPGLDDPPHRNAPSVGVLRVDTKPRKLVYFDWVFGRGTYRPFLNSVKYAIDKYHPAIKALDTTSTQKGLQELAFEDVGIETHGINFSRDKEACLNALSIEIGNQNLAWAPVKGLLRQVSSYTREDDKKVPQDIVMMLAMLAFAARFAPDERPDSMSTYDRGYYNRKSRGFRRKKR